MLNDAFKLTLDQLTKIEKTNFDQPQPFPVTKYSDNVNMWSKLCNLTQANMMDLFVPK